MREEIHNQGKQILDLLRKAYGSDELDDHTLKNISKKYLGEQFIGVYPYDLYPANAPNDSYAIINTDHQGQPGTHWIGIYKKGKTLYVYDSFGRHSVNVLKEFFHSHVAQGYRVIDVNLKREQGEKQNDCGLRSLTYLILEHRYGICKLFASGKCPH